MGSTPPTSTWGRCPRVVRWIICHYHTYDEPGVLHWSHCQNWYWRYRHVDWIFLGWPIVSLVQNLRKEVIRKVKELMGFLYYLNRTYCASTHLSLYLSVTLSRKKRLCQTHSIQILAPPPHISIFSRRKSGWFSRINQTSRP
jgi:hypothetical protein